MARRSRIDIIEKILETIANKGGRIKPTHLMYKSNLSHTQMNGYLEELGNKDFVHRVQEKRTNFVVISEKGYQFLNKIKEMRAFEEGFGL